jgi:hypothetical protein
MTVYALIERDRVSNIIVAEDIETASMFGNAVDTTGKDVGIGYSYNKDTDEFIAPIQDEN